MLFLYEMTRQEAPAAEARTRPTHADSEQLCNQLSRLLERIGFLNPQRPDAILNPLRRLLTRADPDLAELNLLRGMVAQLDASAKDWQGKRRGKN